MLRNDFYISTGSTALDESSFREAIRFDADHRIFKGHFPGLPVVPGVCMMAIVKELLEERLGVRLQLSSVPQIKFLSMINPLDHDSAEVEIKYTRLEHGGLQADAVIFVSGNPFFKMTRAVYR